MIKMIALTWRKPGIDHASFIRHWRDVHAPMAQQYAATLGMRRYIQNHRIESAEMDAFAAARGWSTPPDGIAEAWWDSAEAMAAYFSTAEGQAANAVLQKDEQAFTDTSRVSAFFANEFIAVDR